MQRYLETNLPHSPAELLRCLQQAPNPGLGTGPDFSPLADWLKENPDLGRPDVSNVVARQCCQSGLWLLAGNLDECHTLCQDLKHVDAKLWHGIMHRREGDFWNSKYWMKQIPSHPVFDFLKSQFPEYQSAQKFVDLCERVSKKKGTEQDRAIEIQAAEWQCLFEHCWNQM